MFRRAFLGKVTLVRDVQFANVFGSMDWMGECWCMVTEERFVHA